MAPIVDTLRTTEDLAGTNLFNTPVYERSLEYIRMHVNEERNFIDMNTDLPDRCQIEREGLYLTCSNLERDGGPASATAMLVKRNDETGEVYTYLIINFEYNEQLLITLIDTKDCGA